MKSKIVAVIVALGAFTSTLSAVSVGGPFYFADSVYYLTTKGASWTDSEAEAVSLGGHLATVNSQAEEDFIRQIIVASVNNEVWLGLNNYRDNNVWEWTSGQTVTYLNWNPGEPNFVATDHVVQSGLGWNNTFDNEVFFYGLVEKSVAEGSAGLALFGLTIGGLILTHRSCGFRANARAV